MSFVARYPSTCSACKKAICPGETIEVTGQKSVYRHAYCPGQPGVDRPYTIDDNPYYHRHLEGEMAFTGEGYTRSLAKAITRSEFVGHEEPITCGGCGKKQAWWKATVGTYICVECGTLRGRDGEWRR
jgi:hypothetical protein